MNRKILALWFCAVFFGIIQMSADVIKAVIKEEYFLMATEGVMLVSIIVLGIIVYGKTRRKTKGNN